MLRHALRRLLWIVPILIGVTLASFALLSYVPDPADDPAVLASLAPEQVLELRRARFLDLPRFFNEHPVDVVARVDQALARLSRGGQEREEGERALLRLGGAALPHLLPRLDTFDPGARARVAVALFPIAERMGIASGEAVDPEQAVAFWNRFWADRAIDYRGANARRAVRRLGAHGSAAREADLAELDTLALDQIMLSLEELSGRPPEGTNESETLLGERVEGIRRLVAAAVHATTRGDRLPEGATYAEAQSCVRGWREWWLVHQADYTAYAGGSRFIAMLTDTQYAKWAEKVVLLGVGADEGGVPTLRKLQSRARPTLQITAGALALAYLFSLLLGVAGALRTYAEVDVAAVAIALTLFVVPTTLLAVWAAQGAKPGILVAVVVLAAALVASPLAQGRVLLREVTRLDYVRTARAFGASPVRTILRHALRTALLPLVALFSVELPTALGGAFVVEKALGISGLGEETVRAVLNHDIAWLVGVAFMTALLVTLTSVIADLAIAAIDPRLSVAALRHQRSAG